ncbi:hypothetical protein [Paenibacillus sp. FJAT-26967]|uniref:hypothetical protein n=1 Tax=Paenibacillus sp. FJAT-26967 TaxID=1729690 RepID=UPI000838726F|nr:hypothetical protein [Paenibacillus sp. FJAT-26967]
MKKSLVSFLSAALLLSASSVVLAEQNTVSPQGLITPQAIGADSGWQTKNNIRARVYTDATSYGPGTKNVNVTVEKSTTGAADYIIDVHKQTSSGTWVHSGSAQIHGTIANSASHSIPISSLLSVNTQGTFRIQLRLFQYANPNGPLGEWFTSSFTVVRTN